METLAIAFVPDLMESEGVGCAVASERLETFFMNTYILTADGFLTCEELWNALIPVLSTHLSLKNIKLWGFGGPVLRSFGEIFQKNESIEELAITDALHATVHDMKILCAGLTNNTTLRDLSVFDVKDETLNVLLGALAHDQCKISKLRLRTLGDDESIRILSESLKTNTMLTHLYFMKCWIGSDRCQQLCDGLIQNKSLEGLYFNTCGLGDAACKVLAQLLTKNTSLTKLSLSDTTCGDQGLIDICEALINNTTLRGLKFDGKEFEFEGMTGVKNMLTCNSTLRSLKLTLNFSSQPLVDLICEGLAVNKGLTRLTITSDSYPDDDVIEKFISALNENYALDEIDLLGTSEPFADLLQRNRVCKFEALHKVTILSHNIARSEQALTMLPREIWSLILSLVTHPGMDSFEQIVEDIFSLY